MLVTTATGTGACSAASTSLLIRFGRGVVQGLLGRGGLAGCPSCEGGAEEKKLVSWFIATLTPARVWGRSGLGRGKGPLRISPPALWCLRPPLVGVPGGRYEEEGILKDRDTRTHSYCSRLRINGSRDRGLDGLMA